MFLVMRGEGKRRGRCPSIARDKWLRGLKIGSKHVVYVMRGCKPVGHEALVGQNALAARQLYLPTLDENRGQAIMDWGRTPEEACACWARLHFDRARQLRQAAQKLEAEANVYAKEYNKCVARGWVSWPKGRTS